MQHELPPGCAAAYAVERQLASGGFGTVYLARHRALDRPVALKLLNPEALSDPESVDRFVNEARITASLQHPHIVVLLDHGIDDGVPWIAYEYLPATSLRTRMRDGPLSWRDALALGAQVCSALAVAHGEGILHRDIKPENVLLVDDHTVKVADFGTAKWASGRSVVTGDGVILGTPAYLAPELVAGVPATPQSDIYALGAMLYEMITGSVPFDQGTVAASLRHRLEYDPLSMSERRDGIPPEVDAVVLKAVARSPSDRFMTAQGCHTALLALVDEGAPGTLAAYRRAARANPSTTVNMSTVSAASSGSNATVRTMVPPPRSTAQVPALPGDAAPQAPQGAGVAGTAGTAGSAGTGGTGGTAAALPGRGRALLAVGVGLGMLAGLAVMLRPIATPVREPSPPPGQGALAGDELSPEGLQEADRQLLKLWNNSGERLPLEDAMWSFLADPGQKDTQKNLEATTKLEKALGDDLDAVNALVERLARFSRPAPALAAIRARLAGLSFQLGCRRNGCRIARILPRGVGGWLTAAQSAQHPFDPEAMVRLRTWLDRLVAALALGSAENALDRRTALLMDETWHTACYLNHELEHFPRPAVKAAMDETTLRLAQVPGPSARPLSELALAVLSAWALPAAGRGVALERAKAATRALANPRTREMTDVLTALLDARLTQLR